ncbi:MAG TPA: hypothetical protein DHV57_01280 [Hyphomonas sp.]|jgi:hypothetical protein|uniref:hypothetical protein n=1 Tax=Hyphomonas sp. UBA5107 TaxID=1946636 RepID=UPI000C36A60E|nr:hypothetical protein [Hyphomonas sp. UBA5107]MAA82842.1 hypothetical protein [Hyphomonas sp.]HCJ16029.1 hypothetical protein [Hyphomonas sp.]HCN94806.1 hypothetical protein [Hyphomonas sp.]|tara:strand:+ start:3000 stop:3383 length:384 start_codon:yes stop_codon:yes gene_type:complete
MSKLSPFGACAEHLRLSYAETAEILTVHSDRIYTPRLAKLIREGREPVPAYGWTGLREFDREVDKQCDQLLRMHRDTGGGVFPVSTSDLNGSEMRRVLVRMMLKMKGDESIIVGRHIPEGEQTFGFL